MIRPVPVFLSDPGINYDTMIDKTRLPPGGADEW